ncbi:ankyrin repeat-containing protein At5g02620 isoform X2 [Beta vulgaris subsp. vulgaris]|uniref:ankyrin repeat-containing protein At5g02620 isoform X2 n=1 Tax=Beta vulgaris subsp. vulgaris TaxID=3555 RepID=UPI00053FF1DE|nr:ankyrin repeat-containing protein At5g02620 isoform X2 [Beta vulgaris subsp. vulgaris]
MAMIGTNLQANSSINFKGMEPKLYLAALKGSFDEITSISNWKEQSTPIGNNILHIHTEKPLQKASKDCKKKINIKFIQEVLNDNEAGYSLLWKENNNGDTPLHLAARFGQDEAVQVFLERANNVSQEELIRMLRMINKNKDTALHEAARRGSEAVVKLLVKADTSCLHESNEVGETPLYLAAERGSTASVAMILETCDPTALGYAHKGPCGRTPLHAAVQWGNSEMVRNMLEKDTSLIRIQDDEGLTPLHCAAAEISKFKLLKMLLHYDDKDINESSALYIQDNKGRTALHIAVLRANWDAIKKLTARRPDCTEIVDHHGQNAVHYAAKWGCLNKFETFLEKGQFDNLLNKKDMDGNTPLHLFATCIPNLGHACLVLLPFFIRSNDHNLDLMVFNKQKLTVGDILATKFHMFHPDPIIQRLRSWMAPRGKKVSTYEEEIDIEKANSKAESKLVALRKAAQGQSLVATLIATVSFTAGFTLPGGFNQNSGDKNIGMAVLQSKSSFNIFLISDAIAFTCSSLAILSYFTIITTESTWSIESLSFTALFLNTVALGALMLAFTTGVSVVLSQSPHLVYALWAILMLFFTQYALLVFRTGRAALRFAARCSARNHQLFQ